MATRSETVRVHVLIDLANRPSLRNIYRPNEQLVGARLDALLDSIAERVQTVVSASLLELAFRLYDGWFDDQGRGSELHGMIRSYARSNYPRRTRRTRSLVSLAESTLAASSDQLIHTVRSERGLGRYNLSVEPDAPSACVDPAGCSVKALRSWIKGRCPNEKCGITTGDVTSYRYQKLIDTCLVSDAVWLASRHCDIAVVSDDEDVIPGLLTARSFGARVLWVCKSAAPRAAYARVISSNGIGHIQC